jgi:hypothetical protein
MKTITCALFPMSLNEVYFASLDLISSAAFLHVLFHFELLVVKTNDTHDSKIESFNGIAVSVYLFISKKNINLYVRKNHEDLLRIFKVAFFFVFLLPFCTLSLYSLSNTHGTGT